MLCWQIWLNRNKWLWDNTGSSPLELVSRTRQILSEYEEYCCSLKVLAETKSINRDWQAPAADHIKINFDGATFAESNLRTMLRATASDGESDMLHFELLPNILSFLQQQRQLSLAKRGVGCTLLSRATVLQLSLSLMALILILLNTWELGARC
ncbi:hypothetical protein Salat_1708200 [Sesamum alatum]|uniref:Uncharacterized protein n=1 Tax=Sesamum alatum TaxID=300844 RepID=A0AAE1Y8Q1_9LAMI|nr:hypothetical protein Salat_1708200 [Sesamum alatum]